jgi:hypothetical protein
LADVDELGLKNLGYESGGLMHCSRIGSKNLHPDRAFIRPKSELGQCAWVLPPNPLRRQEFRDHDIGSMGTTDPPKR